MKVEQQIYENITFVDLRKKLIERLDLDLACSLVGELSTTKPCQT